VTEKWKNLGFATKVELVPNKPGALKDLQFVVDGARSWQEGALLAGPFTPSDRIISVPGSVDIVMHHDYPDDFKKLLGVLGSYDLAFKCYQALQNPHVPMMYSDESEISL
jgi:hypothetical protein